jgi:hypothetical protein
VLQHRFFAAAQKLHLTFFDFSLLYSYCKGKEFTLVGHEIALMCYFMQYLVFIKTEKSQIQLAIKKQLCKKSSSYEKFLFALPTRSGGIHGLCAI